MATNKFIFLISIILAAKSVECTSPGMEEEVDDDDDDKPACHCGTVETEKDKKSTLINYYDEKITCQSCSNLEAVNTDIPNFLCEEMKGDQYLKVTVFSDKCRDTTFPTVVKMAKRHILPVKYCSTVFVCCENGVPTECSTEKIYTLQHVYPVIEQST